jgi:hypothetical protein
LSILLRNFRLAPQDRPARHERGKLQIQRFPPDWGAAASNHVGCAFLVASDLIQYKIAPAMGSIVIDTILISTVKEQLATSLGTRNPKPD